MKRFYQAPGLTPYGSVAQITGVLGVSGADDSFIDEEGADRSDEPGWDPGDPGGSTDVCASRDLKVCL